MIWWGTSDLPRSDQLTLRDPLAVITISDPAVVSNTNPAKAESNNVRQRDPHTRPCLLTTGGCGSLHFRLACSKQQMSPFNTKAEFNRKRRHLNETEIADMPMTDVADPTPKPTVYSITNASIIITNSGPTILPGLDHCHFLPSR
jgi:hypothetical protein